MEKEKTINNVYLDQAEISALKKLILYVKFSCNEEESLMFCGSPAINSCMDKILDIDYLGEAERSFFNKRNIKNEEFIMNKIERQQSHASNKMEDETMNDYFDSCLYPFRKD